MTDREHSQPLQIEVRRPHVDGDRVTYAWDQSLPNPFQRQNRWSFTYPGLDLAGFAPELLLEVFLALQVKVWGRHPGPIRLRLPVAMPATTIAFWRDYHRIPDLEASPLADERPRDPWPGGASGLHRQYEHVVFFGGGKDSGAAASLLNEIGGPGSTLLLSHTASLSPLPHLQAASRRRMVEFIQQPVTAATGMPTALFWSDYLSNFRLDPEPPRPDLEFYHAGTLPLLVVHGARVTTFGHGRNEYFSVAWPGEGPQPDRVSGRPETLAAISAHYRRAWGLDIDLAALMYPLASFAHYHVLRDRYPAMYNAFVSCAGLKKPWCHNCPKCLRHMIATLALDAPTATFDYNLLLRSPLVRGIVDELGHHDSGASGYPQIPAIGRKTNNLSERVSQLTMISPSTMRRVLSVENRSTLAFIRGHYLGEIDRSYAAVPRAALATISPRLREPLTIVLATTFELVDDLPDRNLSDGSRWVPQWRVPLTLRGEVEPLVPAWLRPSISGGMPPDDSKPGSHEV